MRSKKQSRTAFASRVISRTPSTRHGGSSATWHARSIWMRRRRYGCGSMSQWLSEGWDSGLPNCAARLTRHERQLCAMRIRSSVRKKSGPTWNNRSMWNRSAGRSTRLARPATLMRVLPKRAVNSPARRKRRRLPWPSSRAGSRSAEDLERLAIPLSATVDQFESQLQETTRQHHLLAERIATEDDSIRQLESRLQSLELEQDVPTEAMVLAARQRRDQGWQLVKAAWLDGAPAGQDHAAFLAEFAPTGTLSSAYEQSVERGDALADRLRREADRVAHKAESLAQLNRHRTARAALVDEGRVLDDRQARIDRDWNALVAPLAIEAESRTPAELRAWLRQREEVVQLLEKVEELRQTLEPLEQTFCTKRAAISQILNEMGEPLSITDSDLAEVLEHAEAVINRHDDLSKRRANLETKLATARAERATAQLSLRTAEAELTAWQIEWSAMMARIGLEAEATPEQAEVFLNKISELLEKLTDRRNHQSRIRGIDRDADEFARDVMALAARTAQDSTDRPAGELARELAKRLRDAQADAQQRTTLLKQRQREEESLRAAETQHEEARVCLERLCQEARCTDFDDLPEAERRSQNLVRLEAARATCEEQLTVAAAGADLAVFCASRRRGRSYRPGRIDRTNSKQRSQPRRKSCAASTRQSAPSGVNSPAWTAATAPPSPLKKRRRSWPGFKGTSLDMQPSNWRRR